MGQSMIASGMISPPPTPTVISGLDPGGPWAFDLRAKGTSNLVSTPQKGKGRWELLNLNCFINYEVKVASSGKKQVLGCLALMASGGLDFAVVEFGLGFVGFWVCGLEFEGLGWSFCCLST
jgi:hypothetical protein